MAAFGRLVVLLLIAAVGLQLYFLCRIALMTVVDPQSTTFQRSEAWRLLVQTQRLPWRQQWVASERISNQLKRAVIASEDAGFVEHSGVEWDALEKAWERNQLAQARADRQNERLERQAANAKSAAAPATAPRKVAPKVVGGSTITQQLAKNLFLSPERSFVRKGQEFAITFMLESVLGKRRILEIYLNNVEWGEGLFGAEAAAQHYFRVPAAQLGGLQAARLAVMLPAPKRFEKRVNSPYMNARASTIAARMGAVELP
ncbi:transglycosylase domain-containing protein [Piscinibacter sakaiensis]|uniref:transglycosylase domain-containing protein n=1 Tax=Piscinibacter sakaiensis TaxID=1547922 RepID=UPI003AABAD22